MSDFSRVSEEVVSFVHNVYGGEGVLSDPEGVRDFLKKIEPLLVVPHIRYIVGESAAEESPQDYMDGMMRRFMETQDLADEALDDTNPRGGAVTRKSVQVTNDGDLYIRNSVTGAVHDSVSQFGVVHGGVHVRREQR